MNKYIFIDVETGGTNPEEHSLFSIGLIVLENEKILYKDEIFIKQNKYNYTNKALSINKMDFNAIKQYGISKNEAVNKIIRIKKKFFAFDKAMLAGYNVQFDLKFLRKLFSDDGKNIEDYFSHRLLDVSSVIKYLKDLEFIPQNLESSDDVFNYFGIKIEKRHTALGDSIGTLELYKKLLEIIRI